MRILIFVFILSTLLVSCKKETEDKCVAIPETSAIKIDLNFESLEDSLPAIADKQQLVNFFSHHTPIRDLLFNREAYPSDSAFINDRYARFTNPAIDTLLTETHRVFGNGLELKKSFEEALTNLKYYYPAFPTPQVKTIITGLETDILVNDSLVLVGIDYYLGPGAKYQPYIHEYMQKRYNKDFIIPSMMLLYGIDGAFNKTSVADKTVLADMITYGKAYYFAKHMIPCVADSTLMGYTKEEIEGSRKNESLIWSRLIEDQVLFSTSHQTKQKYIAERPRTLEVGEKCPGRIGQWVGWQIVKKYMENHSDVTLQELMEMQDPAKLFKESGYKPQVVKLPKKQGT
ncbi:MAG TPA: gliding motility lipoprotein GldB [Cyclobacteriaceae bacterium]